MREVVDEEEEEEEGMADPLAALLAVDLRED